MMGDLSSSALYQTVWQVLRTAFRVPGEPPTLPAAGGGEIRQFKPDRGQLRYSKAVFWITITLIGLGAFIGFLAVLFTKWWLALLLGMIFLIAYVGISAVSFVAIHVGYDTTWYVMSDRSMRLRRGAWSIQETTITYENIQNLKIQQGPLQRFFGISDLIVETAGGGRGGDDASRPMNQGIIRGVGNAHQLRDQIQSRVRATQSAGLGDDDEHRARTTAWTAAHIEVLREIYHAACALRERARGMDEGRSSSGDE
jgi:membrane protein YdbS with pleckstrin-like domain